MFTAIPSSGTTTAWASSTAAGPPRCSTRRSGAPSTARCRPAARSRRSNCKVNFTRPLRREAGRVRCEAHVVHVGSRTATVRGAYRRCARQGLRSRHDHLHRRRARHADRRQRHVASGGGGTHHVGVRALRGEGRIAVLTIDNPPVNALGAGVWEAIAEAVARANHDTAADAIVLIGAGRTFPAGADINIFKTLTTRDASMARSGAIHAMLLRARGLTQAARGGGARHRARRRPRGRAWPVTSGSRRRTPPSDSLKCSSASFQAPAARSASPGWWRRPRARDVHRRQADRGVEGESRRHRRRDRRGRPALGGGGIREGAGGGRRAPQDA